MTKDQANDLVPEKSFVKFAGGEYKVAEVSQKLGATFIGIYDEPPSLHIDYLNMDNVEFICHSKK